MSQSQKDDPLIDPFALWQRYISDSEKRLNETLTRFMGTPQFNEPSSQVMQALTKYQQSVQEASSKYFAMLNLPTRDDIAELGAQLGLLEERLNRIEALLLDRSGDAPAGAGQRRPPRTKKPRTAAQDRKKNK